VNEQHRVHEQRCDVIATALLSTSITTYCIAYRKGNTTRMGSRRDRISGGGHNSRAENFRITRSSEHPARSQPLRRFAFNSTCTAHIRTPILVSRPAIRNNASDPPERESVVPRVNWRIGPLVLGRYERELKPIIALLVNFGTEAYDGHIKNSDPESSVCAATDLLPTDAT
jgi:hypothetical protein